MSNQNDYGIILTLPGFDVDTATPEQCAVHSAYPNPLIKMGAEPKHFGTINVFFASNPGETDVDNPITYIARVPHGYPYAPNTLTIYSFIPLGETETVVGTFPFNASTPANDYFSFGADGPTHAGSFDITYLATLPNFVVMAPSDEAELVRMINTAVTINDRPSAFRYPRGNGYGVELPNIKETIEIGKARIIQEGKQVCLLSLGTRLEECKIAANELKNKGISTTIIDARFAKPLDEQLILKSANNHEVLITIEEGSIGGFGSHVANLLAENGIFDKGLKFRSMILPDVFIDQDTPERMYDVAGLNAKHITQKVLEVFFSKDGIRVIK